MYFAGLIRLKEIPRPLLSELDVFFKKMYVSMRYFTPKTIARELCITEDLAWELTFSVRDLGLITDVRVTQCATCGTIHRKKDNVSCPSCGEKTALTEGIYFIVR